MEALGALFAGCFVIMFLGYVVQLICGIMAFLFSLGSDRRKEAAEKTYNQFFRRPKRDAPPSPSLAQRIHDFFFKRG